MKEGRMHYADQELEMKDAFRRQAQEILFRTDEFDHPGAISVGLESELAVCAVDLNLGNSAVARDKILLTCEGIVDTELGATQMEIRTAPYSLRNDGLVSLREELMHKQFLLQQAAKLFDANILRVGANPFLPIMNTPRTAKPKYLRVPDYQNYHRRTTVDTKVGLNGTKIDIGDASIVSLFQSFQINLDATSIKDAVDKLNRSLMIGPYLLALSGNSRYLELKDTGYNDLRVRAWELSHDTRTESEVARGWGLRIGLPERYFDNIEEYFDRMLRYPFIMHAPENAFAIAVGLTWLDTRIKFIGNMWVVEFRMLPTQPTIEEELALTLFYVGRLIYSQEIGEQILSIDRVRENRERAICFGLDSTLWFNDSNGNSYLRPAREVIDIELHRAKQVLTDLGINFPDELLAILRERLFLGTPSNQLAQALSIDPIISQESMLDALARTRMLI